MTLESTHPLKGTSTRNPPWVKGGRCVGLTNLQPSCHEIWECQPSGTFRAWIGLNRNCFTFNIICFSFRSNAVRIPETSLRVCSCVQVQLVTLPGVVMFSASGMIMIEAWKNFSSRGERLLISGILALVNALIFLVDFVLNCRKYQSASTR